MSLRVSKIKNGLKWSLIDQLVRQLVTIVISGVLSRLLTPAEYGLLGLVMIAIGFLQVFKDVGLGSSIIQKQEITLEEQSTIFWLSFFIGVALAIIIIIAAPYIAGFFNEPRLTLLIRVMSINFLINSLAIVPNALIQKAIDFKSFFYRNLGTILLSGVIGIYMAYRGYGVWALVGQTIITSVAGLLISFRMVEWRPQLKFRSALLKHHLKFSLPLLGDSSINYWVRNIDNLLVGKQLGAASLGIYSRAYSLMLLPVKQISGTLSRVMFPSFSMMQENATAIWNQYCKMIAVVACVSFPLMVFLGVYSREVILIVYGEQWMDAVPLFRVLCVLGAFQSIGSLSGSVFYARGKTLLMFKVGLIAKMLMIGGMVGGLIYGGLLGMVWGYLCLSVVSFLIESYFVTYVLGQKLFDFFHSILPEFLGSFFCFVVLMLAKFAYNSSGSVLNVNFIIVHAFAVCIALLLYLVVLKKLNSTGFKLIANNIYGKAWNDTALDA